ncbi:TPA: hypothetical protein ACIBOM_001645 [Salmonella enterica subsp. enterica serovar Reading]|nr:hypothetical protein [Salmonella enterica subsp. enterica serovar Muenchen]
MKEEHPLLNAVSVLVMITFLLPIFVFLCLLTGDDSIVNDIIAASTFGLFIAAFITMVIAFTNLLRETKPKD